MRRGVNSDSHYPKHLSLPQMTSHCLVTSHAYVINSKFVGVVQSATNEHIIRTLMGSKAVEEPQVWLQHARGAFSKVVHILGNFNMVSGQRARRAHLSLPSSAVLARQPLEYRLPDAVPG